ncbi:MAG: hypothetical protein PHZ04_01535 [Patescibacteria group bacterium]|nr:hypothetical protein [Patescibacteria group bacterium]MDD5294777.1 hypothetical protein [Patescibacteria group bacterium]MDD5554339.1 hypothetical protein [Patescibacteria group bacterium]
MKEKNKKISNGVRKEKQTGFGKIIPIILVVIIVLGAIIGISYVFRQYFNKTEDGRGVIPPDGQNSEMIIGGDKDEHGCLGPAGYSWCEAKQKCLRVWEEACTDEDIPAEVRALAEDYFKSHISELAPEKEVLGGKFYIMGVNFTSRTRAIVDYEDGHNAYQAAIIFTIGENNEINIQKFSLISKNGSSSEFAGNSNPAMGGLLNLFAEKYNKDPQDITIKIDQQIAEPENEIKEYIRGSVNFGPGGIGEGGIFLAVMEEGEYKLVFDGNGSISCELVNQYGFPEEMVSNCYR